MPRKERILTTHTGSLGRSPDLRDMLVAKSRGEHVDTSAFDAACRRAVAACVKRQCEVGLDIINDGEQSKTGFAQYVHERLQGFEGEPIRRVVSLEAREFPEAPTGSIWQQPCTAPLVWKNFAAVERDIGNLKDATAGIRDKAFFMASVSPGSFTNNNPNRHYASRSEYLAAVVDVMRREYEAIAAAGFILQLDSPDLAQRSYNFPDMPLAEWRRIVAENIEGLNWATRNIPREQIRVHVCWGANEGPHNHDTELKDIIDLLLTLRTSAISVVGANGRHEHEWRVWETVRLPDGLRIIPGVIDSTTNIIEHPRVVADRLVRIARILGRENIIAGVDCGFGVSGTARPKVDPQVAWAKLSALAEGARIASEEL
jgi:5-methyltetrahydropteroyltriglutamate--homocysteine methyltransferase